MRAEFAFKEEKSGLFGIIKRPVAAVTFVNGEKEILESLYVDSGADITMLPKSVGELLGFKMEKTDEIKEVKGVGERSVPIIIKKSQIKIDEKTINVRMAWSLIEEVPLLLGRIDVFNLFNISFQKAEKTVFDES